MFEFLKKFNIEDPLLALSVAVENHGFVVSLARHLSSSSIAGTIRVSGKKVYISLWRNEKTYFAMVCAGNTCYRFRSRHLKRLLRRVYTKIRKLGG